MISGITLKIWFLHHKRDFVHYSIGFFLFLLITLYIMKNGEDSIQLLISYSSENIVAVTLILLFLYALKSVSFGIPYALLFATVGAIYPLFSAIFVNILGVFINIQIPYFIGKKRGEPFVLYTKARFPVLDRLYATSAKSEFLFTLILKLIGKIPHEITNLFLGALKITYFAYVGGNLLALLPTLVSITLIAKNYENPSSPSFIISIIIFLSMPIISLLIYFKNRNSNKI